MHDARSKLRLMALLFALGLIVAACASEEPDDDVAADEAVDEDTEEDTEEETELESDVLDVDPVTFTIASVFGPPDVSYSGEALEMFTERVTEATGGAITFDVHWGGAMGAPAEHLDLVGTGVVDLAMSHGWYTPGRLALANFEYTFPFGPLDPEITTRAKWQVMQEFPEFAEDYANENIIELMNPGGTAYHLLSTEPIESLDDMQGKRVALIGEYFGGWVDAAGSTSVVAPAGERFTMMQTGVVSADSLPMGLAYSVNLHDVAEHFTNVGFFAPNWYHLWMNLDAFNELAPEVQDLLVEIGEDVNLAAGTELVPKWTELVEEEFREAGVEFHEFPEEDRAEWAQLAPDTAAEWAQEVEARGYPGFEIAQRYQEIVAELGYEWPRQWAME